MADAGPDEEAAHEGVVGESVTDDDLALGAGAEPGSTQ
jgi:hypothetical protein